MNSIDRLIWDLLEARTDGPELTLPAATIYQAIYPCWFNEKSETEKSRNIRMAVNRLRNEGYPVLANPSGYYAPSCYEDILEYWQRRGSRLANEMKYKKKMIQRCKDIYRREEKLPMGDYVYANTVTE